MKKINIVQFSSLSCIRLFATPWTAACQASHPSTTPRVYSNSCPLSQWCPPTISSSVVPFSSCPQSFPASGSFLNESALCIRWPKYWSFSFNISPSNEHNEQDWSPLERAGWISLWSKGLSRVFSNTTVQRHQFFGVQLSLQPNPHSIHDYWKNHSFD